MILNSKIYIDSVDITPFIAFNGLKWSRHDIDGPNAGRTLSGLMIRDRVATKIRLDIKCRPLNQTDLYLLLTTISPEFVSVTYDDPMEGPTTKTMYANNNEATFFKQKDDNTEIWTDISFPLVER